MSQKNILITGGSSGIGLAIAEKLIEKGEYRIFSVSRSREKIDRAIKERPRLAGKMEFFQADVSRPGDCRQLAENLNKQISALHGLVNNAGILVWGGLNETSDDQWNRVLQINLSGPFLMVKNLLPLLKAANGASVINVSSIASLQPGTSLAYSVAKAGLDMLTQYLASDIARHGIRVNSINPGLVETPLHMDNRVVDNAQAYQEMLRSSAVRYPIGRIGKPGDIAALAGFLLSDESSWINGSIIKADGGTTLYNDLRKQAT